MDNATNHGLKSVHRPEAAYVWQRRWFQALLAILVIFLVLSYVLPGVWSLFYAIRSVLLPVLIGLALAYVFNPVVDFAARRLRFSRLGSTICLMLLSLVLLAVIMVTALPLMISQGRSLINTVQEAYPRYLDQLLERIDESTADVRATQPDARVDAPTVPRGAPVAPGPGESEASAPTTTPPAQDPESAATPSQVPTVAPAPDDRAFGAPFMEPEDRRRLLELVRSRFQELDWQSLATVAMQSLDIGVGLVGSAISFTTYCILAVIVIAFCFFFFSWKLDQIKAWFVPYIPTRHRPQTLDVLGKMDEAVSSFVRGRLIQSVAMMLLLSIGWWLADVPYWFLLAVLTGAMNLVPFLPAAGWLIALALTVMTALAGDEAFTFGLLLWPSVAYFIVQGLDGWAIEPLVQGKATNLDPLTVLLVVLIGGSLAGLLGLLLAIPLAACLKILAREVVLPRLRALAAQA